MIIRKAEKNDIEPIQRVLATAKAFMESTGNYSQAEPPEGRIRKSNEWWHGMSYYDIINM